MPELELLSMVVKEGVAIITLIVAYVLFVKPKDKQITDLVDANKQIVHENSEKLGEVATTMEKISDELTTLSYNQSKLKDGQDELWKEIVQLKRGE